MFSVLITERYDDRAVPLPDVNIITDRVLFGSELDSSIKAAAGDDPDWARAIVDVMRRAARSFQQVDELVEHNQMTPPPGWPKLHTWSGPQGSMTYVIEEPQP